MTKQILFFLLLLAPGFQLHAQMGISTDNSTPDPSAMLDVMSTTMGILVPRMTESQRNAIASPATGLLIFCTDNKQYYTNKGTSAAPNWVMISSQWLNTGQHIYYTSGNVAIGSAQAPALKLQVAGQIGADYGTTAQPSYTFGNGGEKTGLSSPVVNTLSFSTNALERGRFSSDGALMLGTTVSNSAVLLDVTSTTRGFLPPRMTYNQIIAIASPPAGLMIYNTTINTMCWYNGTSWEAGGNRDRQSCGTVTYGGKTYNGVIIGMQCWMDENLDYGTMITGTQDQSNNQVVEKYCYENLTENCTSYGGLYQWGEMVQYLNGASNTTSWSPAPGAPVQGICPTGWHLPSYSEFHQLETYLGGPNEAGGKLKEEGTYHWVSPNIGATNETEFEALPGGWRENTGPFNQMAFLGSFRVSTESNPTSAAMYYLSTMYSVLFYLPSEQKIMGLSVRCLKN